MGADFGFIWKNADHADAPTAQRPVALAFGELLPQPLCGRKSREARRDSRHEQTEGLATGEGARSRQAFRDRSTRTADVDAKLRHGRLRASVFVGL